MEKTKLDKLFTIKHGNKFDLNKMWAMAPTSNAVAFIGRSGTNNGIVGYVKKYQNTNPFNEGFITVALGGSTLSSFVQPRPFYTAQNIDVLEPLVDMTLDIKLYFCLCIEANRFRYSTFGREANRTLNSLLIPDLESIPEWVNGIADKSFNEIREDLSNLYENGILG